MNSFWIIVHQTLPKSLFFWLSKSLTFDQDDQNYNILQIQQFNQISWDLFSVCFVRGKGT